MNQSPGPTGWIATLLTSVIALTVTASAQEQSPPARTATGSAILVTDRTGTKHVLRQCHEAVGFIGRVRHSPAP